MASLLADELTHVFYVLHLNPLTPSVAIWVQLQSILCQPGLGRHL